MNKVKKIFFVMIVFLNSYSLVYSQTVTWQRWYDYNNLDNDFRDGIQTFDDGYIFLMNNYIVQSSTVLIRTNYLGNILWQKLIDASLNNGSPILSYSINQTKDSGFVICGDSFGDSSLLYKVNSIGELQWLKKYSKPGMASRFVDCKVTLDNGIISCGFLSPSHMGYVVKTDSCGIVEWDSTYDLSVGKVIESLDSNYYLLGGEGTLTKISNIGKVIWERNFCCSTLDLLEHPSGNIFTCGGSDSMILNKFDTSGTIIFQKGYYRGIVGCRAFCLSEDGNILLAGVIDTLNQNSIATAKVDRNGNLIFTKRITSIIGGNYAFLPRSVNPTNDSGFIFAGFTDYPGFPFRENGIAVKTDSLCNAPLIVNVNHNSISIANTYILNQNYPNPFNPQTTISYNLPKNEMVLLKLYDINGKEVKTLISEYKQKGYYEFTVDGSQFSSGIYFYKIIAGEFIQIRKMTLENSYP